jgi:hypothetical protein
VKRMLPTKRWMNRRINAFRGDSLGAREMEMEERVETSDWGMR